MLLVVRHCVCNVCFVVHCVTVQPEGLIKCRGQHAVLSLMDAIIEKKVLIPMEDVKVSTQNTPAV